MITITEFPTNPKTSEPFVLKGTATDLENGDELLILVDDQFEVARPRVQDEKWEVTLIFNRGGERSVEVIASDQDKAQITLTLDTGAPEIISRSVWGAKPPKNSKHQECVKFKDSIKIIMGGLILVITILLCLVVVFMKVVLMVKKAHMINLMMVLALLLMALFK